MPEQDDQRGRGVADRYWEGLLEIEPFLGTEIGDERFDDRLADLGPDGRERQRAFFERSLAEAASLDRAAMSEDLRTTLDVLDRSADRWLDRIRWRMDQLDAASHLSGPAQLLAELGSLQRADSPERVDRYVARLAAIPRYLAQTVDILDEAVRDGITQPALVADRTIGLLERILTIPAEDSPALAALPESDAEGRERVVAVVRDDVMPAYQTYLEAMRRYRPSAREDSIGLSALPDGERMYEASLLAFTTVPLTAQEVHEIGVQDYERVQRERLEIATSLGFDDPAELMLAHRESGKDTAHSREEMVRLAEDQVQRSWDAAPRYFGRLPKENCTVRPVEEFREKDVPAAWYYPPTADGSRKGIYWINCSDLHERPLHQVASTTFHEANPGHHFQIAIEQEHEDRPALRRFGGILAGSAFAEGWGLYSERLADEMGLYLDPYERMGMLEAQGWRAGRLVTDSAIHALGWDRERCVQTLVDVGVSRVSAEIEIDRYITWPGQACSYKIGQIELERFRTVLSRREGFSLQAFHDRVLELGSLPLPALRRELGV
jgi:uncharacterized protein (DUF885 family)